MWLLRKRLERPTKNDLGRVIMATDNVTPIRQPDADRDFDKIYGRFIEELNALRCVKVVIDGECDQASEDLAPRQQLFRASTLEIPS